MDAILSVADFRECERISPVPTEELISRAGAAVMAEMTRRFSGTATLVLCGPGNNGKDGAVVARLLKARGWPVRVLGYLYDVEGGLPLILQDFLVTEAIVVDAIFGIGLSRFISSDLQQVVEKVNASGSYVVSVDIPTGINSNTGEVMGTAVKADLTITFSCLKFGHVLSPGRYYSGEVCVKDIGLPAVGTSHAFRNSPSLWSGMLLKPSYRSHKYNRGYAVVCSLGIRSVGAVKLAALAALRAGAGAVAVACEDQEVVVYASALTAVMYKLYEEVMHDPRVTALLIGPGGDLSDDGLKESVFRVLNAEKSTVLDAGAISVFQNDAELLFKSLKCRNVVLTPHAGEFRRIFPNLEGSIVEKAKNAAEISQAVVVLKGHDTVIAAPDGRIVVNNNAPASLATIGSGDVLAGIITGLLATGMPGFHAACCGTWIHGECAKKYRLGLVADDIVWQIPQVLATL